MLLNLFRAMLLNLFRAMLLNECGGGVLAVEAELR
jgi:hypothetical protein